MPGTKPTSEWGSSYRLVAADKWKAKSAAMGRAVTEALVEYAQPRSGMQVLDLASGTGEPAITVAQRVGIDGHVTALDLSAELLEIARKRAEQRQLKNISFQKADAHVLPFPDESFDLATSRFGVMFFANVDTALRDLHRVLRPGARACFAAWGPFEQPYWQTTIGVVLKRVGGPNLAGSQDPFRFSDATSLSAALASAGFHEAESSLQSLPWAWPGTAEELWEYAQAVSSPFRPLLESVPESKWPSINAEALQEISKYADGNVINFGVQIVFASGRK